MLQPTLVWLLLLAGCPSDGPAVRTRCDTDVAALPAHIQQGMSLAHNYQQAGARGYGTETSAATLEELVDLGVEWVSLTPFGFMRSLAEPSVHFIGDYRGGETDARMHEVMRQARGLGLKIMLKPHLWVMRGEWRGDIGFEDGQGWEAWFDSYEQWILHYADMAQAHGAALFVVGVELRSSQRSQEHRWRRLIREVRKRFEGRITYSANWDDASVVPWWDAVDFIGVQFYPPLATRDEATPKSVRDAITTRLDGLESLSKRYGKGVLFTEVGYRAAADALLHPHEWPERARAAQPDPHPQALGYRAFLSAIRSRPWVRGVYWWKWFTDPKTGEEGPAGFSPRGKPAELVLRAAYGGRCPAD